MLYYYWCIIRSLHKKSLSDGNIIRESKLPPSSSSLGKSLASSDQNKMMSESTPDVLACGSGLKYSRWVCVCVCVF